MNKRTCTNCNQSIPEGKRKDAMYCSPACRSNAEYKRKLSDGRYEQTLTQMAEANAAKPRLQHDCIECGGAYETSHRKPSFCSGPCRTRWTDANNPNRCAADGCDNGVRSLGLCHSHHKQLKRSQGVTGYNTPWNDQRRAHSQQRRAMKLGTQTETIKSRAVYERDAWMCGLCSLPVDQALTHPHPMSASLDHVLPLSRGGTHTHDNVQLAHLSCNVRKGARVAA